MPTPSFPSQVRHPNVLAFRDAVELEEGGKIVVLLVTEPAMPLLPTLAGLRMGKEHAAEFVGMGLHAVGKAVAFLNHDCKLVGVVERGGVGRERREKGGQ